MSIIPDDLVESFYKKEIAKNILPRNVHLDRFSEEENTQVVKAKYKLLTRRNLDIGVYLFYALTSKQGSCPQRARVEIFDHEYENKNALHLKNGVSYINLEKVVVEDEQNLIKKIRDTGNTFSYIAKISQMKMNEIKGFSESIRQSINISDETKDVVLGALYDGDITQEFIAKFNI